MASLRVRRWTAHGHDRLYVWTRSGLRVGWLDLLTGRRHLDVPDMWSDFEATLTGWRPDPPALPPAAPRTPAAPRRRPTPRAPRQHSTEDLATRRPAHNTATIAAHLRPRPALRWLAWIVGWRTPDYSWRLGAAGERAVGAQLDRLRRHGWKVLHGITCGAGGDLDHLLIGPAGVLVVNAKHHPGARVQVTPTTVLVRGRRTDYLTRSRREADRVERALGDAWRRPVRVHPVLVFHGQRRLSGWLRHHPAGVQLLPRWATYWRFRMRRARVLTTAEVAQLYALARQPGTWARA